MNEQPAQPNTEQITVWRNLLDAFGQLSAAWRAAGEAQRSADAGRGPGALEMPAPVVAAFARSGEECADTLAILASVLSNQPGGTAGFAEVADAQRRVHEQWSRARGELLDREQQE